MRHVSALLCLGLAACGTTPESGTTPTTPSFTWLPLPDGEIDRIAFGSCANQYLEQPIWDAIAEAEPDLLLLLGDNIYGDAAPPGTRQLAPEIDLIGKMRLDYAFLWTHPGFARVRETTPILATWDDHDYGKNDGGAEFEHKGASRELFLEFFDVPDDSERARTPGLYSAATFGPPRRRVQILLLDTRTFRGPLVRSDLDGAQARRRGLVGRYVPNEDPSVTLLGEAQWRWLEERLREPAEIRLLCSSIQVVAGEKGAESWGNLPHERRRLYETIAATGAEGVVLLSGDVHFSEMSRADEGPYPLIDFTSSPLAQYPTGTTGWEACVNPQRISDTYARDNFGLVEIDWGAAPAPTITLRIVATDGRVVIEHAVSLDRLRTP